MPVNFFPNEEKKVNKEKLLKAIEKMDEEKIKKHFGHISKLLKKFEEKMMVK